MLDVNGGTVEGSKSPASDHVHRRGERAAGEARNWRGSEGAPGGVRGSLPLGAAREAVSVDATGPGW